MLGGTIHCFNVPVFFTWILYGQERKAEQKAARAARRAEESVNSVETYGFRIWKHRKPMGLPCGKLTGCYGNPCFFHSVNQLFLWQILRANR